MKETKVGDTGPVHSWSFSQQPELDIGWVAASMAWQRKGHGGGEIELDDYFSPWRNDLYDHQKGRVRVNFYVYCVEGREDNFSYIAWRIPGRHLGDKNAAQGHPSEWFKITIQKSRNDAGGVTSTTARWERIHPRSPL